MVKSGSKYTVLASTAHPIICTKSPSVSGADASGTFSEFCSASGVYNVSPAVYEGNHALSCKKPFNKNTPAATADMSAAAIATHLEVAAAVATAFHILLSPGL